MSLEELDESELELLEREDDAELELLEDLELDELLSDELKRAIDICINIMKCVRYINKYVRREPDKTFA